MPVRFGAHVVQVVPYTAVRDDFRFVESIGFDSAWLADQFAFPRNADAPILEAWTTLAALARETERVRIGTLVTNVATRNPGILAKSILTIDQLSGGRVNVGVGSGFYREEHSYLGIDYPDGPARSARLAEAVEILDRALRGEHVTYSGEWFRLADAPMHPAPVQQPRPRLYVAGQATSSLRVAARHADVAVMQDDLGSKSLDRVLPRFRRRMSVLDELCADAGRDPATLGRLYSLGYQAEGIFVSLESVTEWVGRLVEAGATELAFYLYNPAKASWAGLVRRGKFVEREMLARVGQEVVPRYRGT